MSYHRIYLKKTIFNQWRALKSLGIQINAGLSHSLVRINLKAKNSTKKWAVFPNDSRLSDTCWPCIFLSCQYFVKKKNK